MKTIKFKFAIKPSKFGYNETTCTHIQIRLDGKFTGFEKHTKELIEYLNEIDFIIPEK